MILYRLKKIYLRGGIDLVIRKLIRRIILPTRRFLGISFFVKLEMFVMLGYWPNLKKPRTSNEKLAFRKLFAPHPLSTLCADKYAVREYVLKKTGRKDILNELYWVGTEPRDIPFSLLPDRFVIKATHGSGWNIFVKDKNKANLKDIISQCEKWMHSKYSSASTIFSETHYDKIPPRIIIERFIEDKTYGIPLDYKFFCFNGKAEIIQVDLDRYGIHRENFYDINWKQLKFKLGFPSGGVICRPARLQDMIFFAEQISSGFDFCRVDLYSPNNENVIFGEITLVPGGGISRFSPREWDFRLGEMFNLTCFEKMADNANNPS